MNRDFGLQERFCVTDVFQNRGRLLGNDNVYRKLVLAKWCRLLEKPDLGPKTVYPVADLC